uniref:Uncharacterized protein n=1 Tax=Anguilla anguilla TaxID=7936 RepID=A0A0E9XEQ1_ANGAN
MCRGTAAPSPSKCRPRRPPCEACGLCSLHSETLSLSLRCAFGRALEHGNIAAGYSLQWHIRDQGKFGQTSSFFSTRFSFFSFFSFSESRKCNIHYETTVKIPSMEGYCALI